MSILVTIDVIDSPDAIDWRYVSRLVLVNVGQPGYIDIKRRMRSIAREYIFDELTAIIIFPPVQDISRVTDLLLTEIGKLYIDNEQTKLTEQDKSIIIHRGSKDV